MPYKTLQQTVMKYKWTAAPFQTNPQNDSCHCSSWKFSRLSQCNLITEHQMRLMNSRSYISNWPEPSTMQWDQLARLDFSAAINRQDDKQHCKSSSFNENDQTHTWKTACMCTKASFLKKKGITERYQLTWRTKESITLHTDHI